MRECAVFQRENQFPLEKCLFFTDKSPMAETNFAQILQELLSSTPEENTLSPSENDHFSLWLSQLQRPEVHLNPSVRQVYKQKNRARTPPPAKPIKPELTLNFTELSPVEQHAWREICQIARQSTSEKITLSQLKKIFRGLAKELHPDHNTGFNKPKSLENVRLFRTCQQHYQLLRQRFKQLNQPAAA